jgi:glyoxylase-like metal-dependent hydrolase (beta-lactamase superfamily II)
MSRSAFAVSLLVVFGCVVIASPAAAQAMGQPQPATASAYAADMSLPSAEQGMKEVAHQLAPRIHAFIPPLGFGPVPLANELLVEQADGLVLVDAGKTRGAGQRIVALIRSISPKPVKAVILTHWHPDHVLGLGPILEAWPQAAIVSSALTRQHILDDESYRGMPRAPNETAARDESRPAALAKYADEYGPHIRDPSLSEEERRGWADVVGVLRLRMADERGTYLVVPTTTFTDRYLIDDPVAPVEALALGGAHTDGDIVVWTPKQRVAAAGDMIVAPIPYGGSRVVEWPATLGRLEALGPMTIVPGHGPVQTDTRYADQMIAAFREMIRKVEPFVPGPSLTEDEVMSKIDLSSMRAKFAGKDPWLAYWFDQYLAPNAGHAYTELRTRTPR